MPKKSTIGHATKLTSRVSVEKLAAVERAKQLLRVARYARSDRESVWRDNVSRYKGKQWPDDMDNTADRLVINMTFSTITTIIPFVTGGDIKFLVEPLSKDAEKAKATVQKVYLNRMWTDRDVAGGKRVRQGLTDSLIYGDGFSNVTYDVKAIPQYDATGRAVPNSEQDTLTFNIQRVSPWDVFLDPDATELSDARYYFVRYTLPVKDVQEDKRFFNTKGLEAEANDFDGTNDRVERNQYSEEANRIDDFVILYDFYDAEKRRLITFSNQSDNPLRWIEDVARTLVQFPNHTIPDSPWHMSEVEVVASLQDELNKTRSQMITFRRQNAVKYLYRADLLSDDAVNALTSSIANQGVPIDADLPMDDIVSILVPPELQQDLYNLNELVRSEIYELTGVNEYLRGAAPGIRRTATEASIIEGGTNVKTTDKLRIVEYAAEEIGQLILDISADTLPGTDYDELSQYITGREAEQVLAADPEAAVYDPQGRPLDTEMTIEPQLFVGRYQVKVERGSTELRNPQLKEQRYKEMFMTVASTYPVLVQAGVQPDLKRFLELWLEAAGVDDLERMFINMEQDPQAGQLLAQYDPMQGGLGSGIPEEQPIPGRQQSPGQPKPEATQAPTDLIDASNSGMLPPI